MIKYRITTENGYFETIDLNEAKRFGNYQTINEDASLTKVVPATITQLNLRVQLVLKSIPIASIYALIETIPNEEHKLILYNKFEYANEFDRADENLNLLANMLNVTQETLDQIFIDGNL